MSKLCRNGLHERIPGERSCGECNREKRVARNARYYAKTRERWIEYQRERNHLRRKPCQNCGGEKEPGIRRHLCDSCRSLTPYRRQTSTPAQQREWRLRTIYGISSERYDEMLRDQNGVCAICMSACTSGFRLAVDHDHHTGRVRGLLCRRCNLCIGRFEDDPDILLRASEYLR